MSLEKRPQEGRPGAVGRPRVGSSTGGAGRGSPGASCAALRGFGLGSGKSLAGWGRWGRGRFRAGALHCVSPPPASLRPQRFPSSSRAPLPTQLLCSTPPGPGSCPPGRLTLRPLFLWALPLGGASVWGLPFSRRCLTLALHTIPVGAGAPGADGTLGGGEGVQDSGTHVREAPQ